MVGCILSSSDKNHRKLRSRQIYKTSDLVRSTTRTSYVIATENCSDNISFDEDYLFEWTSVYNPTQMTGGVDHPFVSMVKTFSVFDQGLTQEVVSA